MKPLRANVLTIAKTTSACALCVLIASSAGLRADDQAKQKAQSADTRGLQDGSASKDQRDKTQSERSSIDDAGGTGSATGTQAGGLSSLSNQEEKFIRDAAKGGKMEVQMGKLGVQKAQNSQVKQFAQKLVDDHTKANAELRQLASKKGINLPQDSVVESSQSDRTRVREKPDSGTDHSAHGEHQAHMSRLQQLSGAEFDRAFVRMAVNDHQKDVKEFEKQAQKATDPDVKEFAQKTAPILREHLQQAQSLQSQVGQGSETGQGSAGSESSSSSGQDSSSSPSDKENSSSGSSKSSGTGSGIK